MELETDKAVVEVPSSVTGTIGEVRVKEGDKLKVGQVIFTLENGTGTTRASKTEKAVGQSGAVSVPEPTASTIPVPAAPANPALAATAQPDRRVKLSLIHI